MTMRDCDHIKARDTARPEIGSDDIFAEVELGAAGPDGASGIDQQRAALRCYEQGGIAFADVDRSHLQDSRTKMR